MSDKPIIFSGEMVRALLAGRKSMTRRILKSQPPEWVTRMCHEGRNGWIGSGDGHGVLMHVPYAPGDRLWVREAHSMHHAHGQGRKDGKRWGPWGGLPTTGSPDGTQIAYYREGFDRCDHGRWRPSIHMPRWASRLTLIVTDVRVQRLAEISEEDARAEGVCSTLTRFPDGGSIGHPASWHFEQLWGQIHGPGAWDANPWCAVISFEVKRANIDAL